MGKSNKNPTVIAVSQNMQQQAVASVALKNAGNQAPKAAQAAPKMQHQAMPAKHANSKTGNLAPLTPGLAASGLPDSVFGNMFDLPAKWVNACKPATPVRIMMRQEKQHPRKQRAPKNSTNEIFNLAAMFVEPKDWATVAPVAPKRMPGGSSIKKQAMQQQQPAQIQQKPATPKSKGNVNSKPAKPASSGQPAKNNVTSAVDWQVNIWEDFYTANKHHTFIGGSDKSQTKQIAPQAAPNVTPNRAASGNKYKQQQHPSLKSTIPPPKAAKDASQFGFIH